MGCGLIDAYIYEALYYSLLSRLDREAKKSAEQKLYAMDATTIGLCMHDFPWGKIPIHQERSEDTREV
ncbi:MAG: hypothetical protein WCR31_00010 [Treponema sp.]